VSEFFASKRIVTAALAASLGLVGCGTRANDIDHYIQNIPSPHSENGSIPEGKVFPPDARVHFYNDAAEYHASPEVAAQTGLYGVLAFCGNPVDKRDPHNLYATMGVRKEGGQVWEVTAGIAAAAACADGTITAADRSVL
jgi:hypothetical protein